MFYCHFCNFFLTKFVAYSSVLLQLLGTGGAWQLFGPDMYPRLTTKTNTSNSKTHSGEKSDMYPCQTTIISIRRRHNEYSCCDKFVAVFFGSHGFGATSISEETGRGARVVGKVGAAPDKLSTNLTVIPKTTLISILTP